MDEQTLSDLILNTLIKDYDQVRKIIQTAADRAEKDHIGSGKTMTESQKQAIRRTSEAKALMPQSNSDHLSLFKAFNLLCHQGNWQTGTTYWPYPSYNTKFLRYFLIDAAKTFDKRLYNRDLKKSENQGKLDLLASSIYWLFLSKKEKELKKDGEIVTETRALTGIEFNADTTGFLLASLCQNDSNRFREIVFEAVENAQKLHSSWQNKRSDNVSTIVDQISAVNTETVLLSTLRLMAEGHWEYQYIPLVSYPSFNTLFVGELVKLAFEEIAGHSDYGIDIEDKLGPLKLVAEDIATKFRDYGLSNKSLLIKEYHAKKLEDQKEDPSLSQKEEKHQVEDLLNLKDVQSQSTLPVPLMPTTANSTQPHPLLFNQGVIYEEQTINLPPPTGTTGGKAKYD